jgi:hypothetical protein
MSLTASPSAPSSIRLTSGSRSTALRSVGVIVAALILIAIASAVADQVMIWLGIFPHWGQITYEPAPYALAVAYRAGFGVGGSFLAARWAPRLPMRHALLVGAVGTILSVAGVIVALTHALGPVWYPITLLMITFPCAWLGGTLHARGLARVVRNGTH